MRSRPGGRRKATPSDTAATGYVAPSRQGKKAVGFYLDPEKVRELKQVALDNDLTIQAILEEAVVMTLMRYRRRAT